MPDFMLPAVLGYAEEHTLCTSGNLLLAKLRTLWGLQM